jgi:two-component system response regulator AtoC
VSKEGLILFVDDDPGTRKVARANLPLDGFEVLVASSGAEALARLAESDPLAVVTDLKMPDGDGITLMERIHAERPALPVVLVTAHATVETAVQALRRGARHYLVKPIRWDELALVLQQAVAQERARRDLEQLRGELDRAAGFEELVGSSPAMQEVFRVVQQVAEADASVLLRGETGTGKELVARALHRRSARRDRPFVAVNCTAVPRELMESEFFGHEKGAFTGAVARRQGRFQQAEGGTLFLDEVGDLDLAVQAKLLRALQEREISRVGAERAERVDVRVVAATNRDLEAAVKQGTFRADLYYRLHVVSLRIPPLRERREDIPLLAEHFAQKHGRPEGSAISPAARELLLAHDWPGNVRELENVVARALALNPSGVVMPEDLPEAVRGTRHSTAPPAGLPDVTDRPTLAEVERRYATQVLQETAGNKTRAAEILGIDRKTLYRILGEREDR